jgi:hypothetical protein
LPGTCHFSGFDVVSGPVVGRTIATDAATAGRLVAGIIIMTAAQGEKRCDEDCDDDGYEADHEQEHRTTQQGMAVSVAPARLTRPSTRAFPPER